jgi:hypothetical protein
LLVIKEPVVGPKIRMEPDCVVQAGELQTGLTDNKAMRRKGGGQQQHVRCVGSGTDVNERVVWKGSCRPEPELLLGLRRFPTPGGDPRKLLRKRSSIGNFSRTIANQD